MPNASHSPGECACKQCNPDAYCPQCGAYMSGISYCSHCPWRRPRVVARGLKPKVEPDNAHKELAGTIISFLKIRNRGELRGAFDNMRVKDQKLMMEELSYILANSGLPPNWTPIADDE